MIGAVTVTTVLADLAGLVAGEFQINFTVPQQFATLAAGTYPISIQVNGYRLHECVAKRTVCTQLFPKPPHERLFVGLGAS
jgi:hypothetical protein